VDKARTHKSHEGELLAAVRRLWHHHPRALSQKGGCAGAAATLSPPVFDDFPNSLLCVDTMMRAGGSARGLMSEHTHRPGSSQPEGMRAVRGAEAEGLLVDLGSALAGWGEEGGQEELLEEREG